MPPSVISSSQAWWLMPAIFHWSVLTSSSMPRCLSSQRAQPWTLWQSPTVLMFDALEHRAGDHRHRVDVVEEPRVGADGLHVVGEVEADGDGPQGAEDAADAQRVGDGLAQAVLLGDLEVDDRARVVAADLDGVDDVVGPAEGGLAGLHAAVGGDLRAAAVDVLVEDVEHLLRFPQAGAVDVVQRDVGILERFGQHGVAENGFREDAAAGAHERDLWHLSFSRLLWGQVGPGTCRPPSGRFKLQTLSKLRARASVGWRFIGGGM